MNKKLQFVLLIVILLFVSLGIYLIFLNINKVSRQQITPIAIVNNFEECVGAGNPVMESYPRQCRSGDKTFVEEIGNVLEKADLINLDNPRPGQIISSPLVISGQARGTWFFEASFPIVLTDWDGRIIAQGIAQAKSDWMTMDFVSFEATLIFEVDMNTYSNKGSLILQKDNPSGLSQNDDALEIPIVFDLNTNTSTTTPPGSPVFCTMEAKLCPDGSAVGRSGPNCEFTPCSQKSILPYDSGVEGVVTLGPTCPVMRVGDTTCNDNPYATTIQIFLSGSAKSSPFTTVNSDKNGAYKVMLPPGEYAFQPVGGSTLPYCETKNITVNAEKITKVDLTCDTGIR
ncbi:MAG TPA: Gmad2 immunoglobulin-like domain-containing protein [Patescibacteria group bacterium]|nr:Gmad2 immunoglobulin-like domain-containing protein [Patescibacteria group bacterium]